jgi:hypothetical protein
VRPVLVEWADAHFAAEELTLEQARLIRPEPTLSVGYPVEGDGCLLLFMSAFKDHPDRMAEYLAIPKGMIVRIAPLIPTPPVAES